MRSTLTIFAFVFAVYAASPMAMQSDSIWVVPTAASLLHEGDLDLDEFAPTVEAVRFGTDNAGGHYYSTFPVAVGVVAAPFVWCWDQLNHLNRWIYAPPGSKTERRLAPWEKAFHGTGLVDIGAFYFVEHLVASLFTAAAMVLVFLTARRRVPALHALAVTAIAAFGTSAFSTASRVLWQHGPSMLALSGALFLLTEPKASRWRLFLLGVVVAAAYALRPTNAITVVLVSALVALRSPRQLAPYFAGALLIAVPFCGFALHAYGSLLPPYYMPQRLEPGAVRFWEALAGNLISPGRGLFVFSPVLIVAAVRVVLGAIRRDLSGIELLCAVAIALHWFAISAFPHWWGGHSIGPRLFTDVIPYFAYLLVHPVDRVISERHVRRTRAAVVGVLAAFSIVVHAWSSISPSVHAWNDGPPAIDDAPGRLWDWGDLQFLRGIAAAPP